MDYLLVGINHHKTPLEVREKFSLNEGELSQFLKDLLTLPHVEEGMLLSTCNRVEILTATDHALEATQNIKNFMVQKNHLEKALLEPHWYDYRSYDAVVHGFRVASSLDSMVVGEPQILGQVKKAFEQAVLMETTGFYLNRYMHRAFYVAKQVRTHTGIAKGAVSIGSVAVDLVKKIFGTFNSKKVALIGVGKMGRIVVNHLKALGVGEVSLVNRTVQDNCSPLSELPKVLAEVDVVLSSLSSHNFLITETHIKEAMETRKNRPLFLIDLGVPRNIESSASHLSNVYLFNIDDLQNIADNNLHERKKELVKAEELVKKEATKFYRSMLEPVSTIASLSKKLEGIRYKELEKSLKKLGHLGEKDKKSIDELTRAIVNRILHDPILMLKSEETDEGEWDSHELLSRLFKLDA